MNAEQYKAQWATLTGKSEREIYVPLALREPKTFEEGEIETLMCCNRSAVKDSADRRG